MISGTLIANLGSGDIERTIEFYAGKLGLEEYDLPGLKTEKGVVGIGGYKAAWFKDPDGNVLGLLSGP